MAETVQTTGSDAAAKPNRVALCYAKNQILKLPSSRCRLGQPSDLCRWSFLCL